MSHPHQLLLDEYRFAVKKLVPLAPPEVVAEAERLEKELSENEQVTERQIVQALIEVGKKEYPYRKAYEALCASDEERRLEDAAFAHLDAAVAEKVRAVTQHGVHITDYAKSKLFEEQLSPDERYQVDQAILRAHDEINRQCDERAHARKENFNELVATWTAQRDTVDHLIDALRSMAERSPELAQEILGQADMFAEGWSIVARDPEENDVRQAISSYATQLEEAGDDDTLAL